jgi:hypothetical protein
MKKKVEGAEPITNPYKLVYLNLSSNKLGI